MPKGTRVDRCFRQLKKTKGESSAAAICQKSTGQSLATGSSKRKSDGKPIGSSHSSKKKKSKSESIDKKLHSLLLSDSLLSDIRPAPPATHFSARLDQAISETALMGAGWNKAPQARDPQAKKCDCCRDGEGHCECTCHDKEHHEPESKANIYHAPGTLK